MRKRTIATAVLAVAASGSAALTMLRLRTPRPETPPNIVLVVVDTLRADVLGSYGSSAGVSPFLDRVATEAVRFDQVVAPAPWTVPSLSSLVTSRYPSEHGQGAQRTSDQGAPLRTLAEILAERGYRTAAFAEVTWPLLEQGFKSFQMPAGDAAARLAQPERDSGAVTFSEAIRWLRRPRGRPVFLMVHTYEAHDYFLGKAYQRAFARRLRPAYSGRFLQWAIRDLSSPLGPRVVGDLRTAGEDDIAFVRGLYLGAVQAIDRQVGELDRALEETGIAEDTVLVVTADHGEGFQPWRGRVSHGGRLHEDLLRVPLLIRWPGRLRPAVVTRRVQSIDVVPTLLVLAGVDRVPGLRGRALLAPRGSGWEALLGKPRFAPAALAEQALLAEESSLFMDATGRRAPSSVRQVALYLGDTKLIHSSEREELYELKSDPREENNLAERRPRVLTAMRDEVSRLVPTLGATGSAPAEDTLQLLRSLGYVQ